MNFPPNTEKHTSEISGRGGEDGAAPDRQGVRACWVEAYYNPVAGHHE